MILIGKNIRSRSKTCPSATFSTTNPTRTDPGANPGLRAINRLSYGTARTVNTAYNYQGVLLVPNARGDVYNMHAVFR
jgi:hypothetical protein